MSDETAKTSQWICVRRNRPSWSPKKKTEKKDRRHRTLSSLAEEILHIPDGVVTRLARQSTKLGWGPRKYNVVG